MLCTAAESDRAQVVMAEEVFAADVPLPIVVEVQTRAARSDRPAVDLRGLMAGLLRIASRALAEAKPADIDAQLATLARARSIIEWGMRCTCPSIDACTCGIHPGPYASRDAQPPDVIVSQSRPA